MARGMTKRANVPFVMMSERDTEDDAGNVVVFPPEDRTEFDIRHLDGVEMIECQTAARQDANPISMAFNLALAACRIALTGWKNYQNDDGVAFPFPGNGRDAVKRMDPRHILEVGTEIARMSMPTGVDMGKSGSGSSAKGAGSGNSVSPVTKPTLVVDEPDATEAPE